MKLDVFKKCCLGGLQTRFQRPQGSILKGLGSIFRGFGRRKRCLRAFSWRQTLCHRLVLHHWGVRGRVPVLPCPCSDGRGAHRVGGWRCPPTGAFNPPATEGVPTACRIHFQLALSNHSWPISVFFRAFRSEVFFPLSFPFPRRWWTNENPTPKSGKFCFFFFFRIFDPNFCLPNGT